MQRLIFILLGLSFTLCEEAMDQTCTADASCEESHPTPMHSEEKPSLAELKRQLVEARNRVKDLEASIQQYEPILPRRKRDKQPSHAHMASFVHPLTKALSSWIPDDEAIKVTMKGGAVSWSSFFQLLANSSVSSPSSPPYIFQYFNDPVEQWNSMTGKKGPMPSVKRLGGKPFDPPGQILVGDGQGKVMVYSPLGSLIMNYDTGSASRVTAMTSYSLKRNESVLVTGHEDGEVRIHLVSESYDGSQREFIIAAITHFHTLLPIPLSSPDGAESIAGISASVTHLCPFRMNGKVTGKRLFAAADALGRIRLVSDTDGMVRYSGDGGQGKLLAMQVSGNILVGLGARRAVVVNLLKPSPPFKQQLGEQNPLQRPRTLDCFEPQHPLRNLSSSGHEAALEVASLIPGSSLITVAFDPIRKFRAYGLTDRGEMAAFYIPHDTKTSSCKLSKVVQPFNVPSDETFEAGSVALSPLRGHLFVSLSSRVLLFNITLFSQGKVKLIISSSSSDLLTGGLGQDEHQLPSDPMAIVTVVGNSNLLIVSSPGQGSFTFHTSHLPIPRGMAGEAPSFGLRGIQQVAFMVIMIFVGLFQFFKARSRRLDLVGPRGRRSFFPDDEDDGDGSGLEDLQLKLDLKGGGRGGRRKRREEDDSEGDNELNQSKGLIGQQSYGGMAGRGGVEARRQQAVSSHDITWGVKGASRMRSKSSSGPIKGGMGDRSMSRVNGDGMVDAYDASRRSYGVRVAQIEQMRGTGDGDEDGSFPMRSSMRAARMGARVDGTAGKAGGPGGSRMMPREPITEGGSSEGAAPLTPSTLDTPE